MARASQEKYIIRIKHQVHDFDHFLIKLKRFNLKVSKRLKASLEKWMC